MVTAMLARPLSRSHRRLVGVAAIGVVIGVVAGTPRRAQADWATDCGTPTVTYGAVSPAPANLNLTAADRVLFTDGTYTGSVNSSGATICVDVLAAFNPTNINGAARLFVRGSALMPPLAAGDGALLDNEGTVRFLPQPNTNGITTVINRAGASILVDAPGLALGPGVTVTNDGTITVNGFVNMNSPGPTVTNNNEITITGALNVTGTFTNNDQTTVGGLLTVNGGGHLGNSCSLAANGLINDEQVTNSGVIDVRPGSLNNTGGSTYTQTSTAVTVGAGFTNDGTVNGAGQYLFSGTTTNQGTMVSADGANPIVFYDTTPTGAQIFDVQLGTITNTVRQPVSEPPPGSCNTAAPRTDHDDHHGANHNHVHHDHHGANHNHVHHDHHDRANHDHHVVHYDHHVVNYDHHDGAAHRHHHHDGATHHHDDVDHVHHYDPARHDVDNDVVDNHRAHGSNDDDDVGPWSDHDDRARRLGLVFEPPRRRDAAEDGVGCGW